MKDNIRILVDKINTQTDNRIDDLRNLASMFLDGDEETNNVVVESARSVLGEIIDPEMIRSFDRKLITADLLNLISYSSFVSECTILGEYSARDIERRVDYHMQVTECLLTDGRRYVFLSIQEGPYKE